MSAEKDDVPMKKEDESDSGTGYAILTDDFIKTAFESLDSHSGISALTQEAIDALNQDVCYRIRELIHVSNC